MLFRVNSSTDKRLLHKCYLTKKMCIQPYSQLVYSQLVYSHFVYSHLVTWSTCVFFVNIIFWHKWPIIFLENGINHLYWVKLRKKCSEIYFTHFLEKVGVEKTGVDEMGSR